MVTCVCVYSVDVTTPSPHTFLASCETHDGGGRGRPLGLEVNFGCGFERAGLMPLDGSVCYTKNIMKNAFVTCGQAIWFDA